jgi:hypothetical protein
VAKSPQVIPHNHERAFFMLRIEKLVSSFSESSHVLWSHKFCVFTYSHRCNR